MALSPRKKEMIQGYLVQGLEIPVIAEKLGVSRAAIYTIKSNLEADHKRNDISVVGNATPTILREVAEGIRAKTPRVLEKEVTKVLKGAEGLQRLESNFHDAVNVALTKGINMLNKEKLSIQEWQIITNTIANAHKEIFSTKGTTINVGQADNISGGNNLSMFQSRM